MTNIQWLPSFETGITSIDDDHRELVEALADIQAALESDDFGTVIEQFEGFLMAARAHFSREEVFLKKIYFPRLESHAATHNELLQMADGVIAEAKKGMDGARAKKHLEDLVYFLLEDVIKADADFKSYVQEHGTQ